MIKGQMDNQHFFLFFFFFFTIASIFIVQQIVFTEFIYYHDHRSMFFLLGNKRDDTCCLSRQLHNFIITPSHSWQQNYHSDTNRRLDSTKCTVTPSSSACSSHTCAQRSCNHRPSCNLSMGPPPTLLRLRIPRKHYQLNTILNDWVMTVYWYWLEFVNSFHWSLVQLLNKRSNLHTKVTLKRVTKGAILGGGSSFELSQLICVQEKRHGRVQHISGWHSWLFKSATRGLPKFPTVVM